MMDDNKKDPKEQTGDGEDGNETMPTAASSAVMGVPHPSTETTSNDTNVVATPPPPPPPDEKVATETEIRTATTTPTAPGAVAIPGPSACARGEEAGGGTIAAGASPATMQVAKTVPAAAAAAVAATGSVDSADTPTVPKEGEDDEDDDDDGGDEDDKDEASEDNDDSNPPTRSKTTTTTTTTTTSSLEDCPPPHRATITSTGTNSSLPVAEEYHELPVISAIRVTTMATASAIVYNVDIDGEGDDRDDDDDDDDHDLEHQPDQKHRPRKTAAANAQAKYGPSRRWLLPTIIIMAVITVIVLVVVLVAGGDDKNQNTGQESSHSYPCFTSTLDIIEAQIVAPKDVSMAASPLIICPNTRIRIGTFRNPSRNDFNMTDGDYTLIALRPNVTIQCGLDGKRSNNCTLDGGLAHVVTQSNTYHPKYGFVNATPNIDNFVLRGVTFTGQIQGAGVFGGVSVALSHPGTGIRFEDCAWIDLTATKRLITVGTNYLLELMGRDIPDLSVEFTMSNCLLDNVIYEEELMVSLQQSFHVENTTFRNVKLAYLLSAGCGVHPNGCRNLLYCQAGGPSKCSISNLCVENIETTGAAPIFISNETEWTSSGTNLWYGPEQFVFTGGAAIDPGSNEGDSAFNASFAPPAEGVFGEWATIEPSSTGTLAWNNESSTGLAPPADGVFGNVEDAGYCDLGVARMDDDYWYNCLDPPVFQAGTSPSGCPMPR